MFGSVRLSLICLMVARNMRGEKPKPPMTPNPPALLTAAANFGPYHCECGDGYRKRF